MLNNINAARDILKGKIVNTPVLHLNEDEIIELKSNRRTSDTDKPRIKLE